MPKAKLDYFSGLRVVFRYLKPHRREIFALLILSTISSLSNALLPYILGRILDAVRSGDLINLAGRALPQVVVIIAVWFFVKMAGDLADWRLDVKNEQLGAVLEGEYIVNGFGKLFELPMSFHKTRKVGEIANRISRAAGWLYSIINAVLINLAPQFLSIFIGLAIVFSIKPIFGAILLPAIIIYSFILIQAAPKLSELQERMHKAYNRAYGDAYDAVANIQPIKQATAEKFEIQKIYKIFQLKAVKFYNEYIAIWQSFSQIQKILITFTQLSIFIMSYILISRNELTLGQMVMFISYGAMVFGPFMNLGRNWQTIQNGLVAIQRSEKILSLPSEQYHAKGGLILDNVKGNVEYYNVYFSYEGKKQVLKGIDFKVKVGETIALVGESGVGKTTIIDLLSRFYEPAKGRILLDRHNIKELNLTFLRKQIAVVPQEVVLFNDTIKNNIRYGNFSAGENDVKKAAQSAHASEFIETFPKKYNQIVGERGVKLSVGQKQRVAIARAILRNPRILVLDEPTSALDAESEKYVTEALEKLMEGRTTFIIAHRLSTVRKADKIIVLDKGEVVEMGRHDELIKKPGGVYKKLYELQFALK